MPEKLRWPPRLGFCVLVGMLAFACAACDSGKRQVFPVSGRVVAGKDKKPAKGTMVIFHPVAPVSGPEYKPVGVVDDTGKFVLTTYKEGDGAPAGEYLVTLQWIPQKKTPLDPDPTDVLEGAYADAKKSKIRFTVGSDAANEVPVIQLP